MSVKETTTTVISFDLGLATASSSTSATHSIWLQFLPQTQILDQSLEGHLITCDLAPLPHMNFSQGRVVEWKGKQEGRWDAGRDKI